MFSVASARSYVALRIALATLIALAVVVGVGFATGLIKVYDAPMNAGVVVGTDHSNFGYEWRGAPGWFVDND
jgi:hypothetical protein